MDFGGGRHRNLRRPAICRPETRVGRAPRLRDRTSNPRPSPGFDSLSADSGFSLIEMIVVVAIVSIVLAIATPSVVTWRSNLYFGQTSKDSRTVLRQAQNMSMAMNRQHYVVFKPNSSANRGAYAFKLIRRSVDPTNTNFANYSCVQKFGTNSVVSIQGTTATPMANIGFTFNPNGTVLLSYPGGNANDGNVGIYNLAVPKYLVSISKTGKIISTHY